MRAVSYVVRQFGFILIFCLVPITQAAGAEIGPGVYDENPLLSSLKQRDEKAAADLLDRIKSILSQPRKPALPKGELRAKSELRSILEQNPLLQEAYQRDPRATAKLIGIIRPTN